jgi:NDP-hexose-3-ketoreductase
MIRFGVLGAADIAWRRMIPALNADPRTQVTWVASRDPERARRFADEFGCGATDYAGLLARADVDAVYLPLPPALHLRWGLAVLGAGKHLLVEKPLAPHVAEANELVRAAAAYRRVLRENFMFVHHAQHAAVLRALADRELGEVRGFDGAFNIPPRAADDIRYRRDLGGGALLDLGVYPLRAAQTLLGPGLQVVGAGLRINPKTGVDMSGKALLTSAAGALATVSFGFEHAYGSHYELWGSTERLYLERAFTSPPDSTPQLCIAGATVPLKPDDQAANAVAAFADAVLDGRSAADEVEAAWCADAVETVRLANEVERWATTVPAATVFSRG